MKNMTAVESILSETNCIDLKPPFVVKYLVIELVAVNKNVHKRAMPKGTNIDVTFLYSSPS
jgi:hypothetical protein